MRLRFVTTNAGKLREAQAYLGPLGIRVVLRRARVWEVQADRLDEIARNKARQLRGRVPPPYMLEDAGLFVHALGGFPGPYSAYALRTLGCKGILRLLRTQSRRARDAHFEAVVAFVDEAGRLRLFRGRSEGRIAERGRGRHGFGFDPIFLPHGQERTFAELEAEAKSRTSHRGQALAALARHLRRAATFKEKG